MSDFHPPFLPSCVYHVYNHANGSDNIFREQDNYRYFLEKYIKYIHPVADTYAYCLLKNHFHFMLKIKDFPTSKIFKNLGGGEISRVISQRFSNFFNSYAKAYNKKYSRFGSLFAPNFRRKIIEDEEYYTDLILYIHNNPVHHALVKVIRDWPYSSYNGIIKGDDPVVKVDEVIRWFGNKNEFIAAHVQPGDEEYEFGL